MPITYEKALVKPSWMKRIIQRNEDVGKMAAGVPAAFSKSFDIFIDDFLAGILREISDGAMVNPSLIKSFISKHKKYSFLKGIVDQAVESTNLKRGANKKRNSCAPARNRSPKKKLRDVKAVLPCLEK